LASALDPALWIDGNHLKAKHGNKVFDREKDAVKELMELKRKGSIPDATLQGMIDKLVHADQILASDAITQAIVALGDHGKIAQAQIEMLKAAAELAHHNYDDAIEHYGKAWERAEQAMGFHTD